MVCHNSERKRRLGWAGRAGRLSCTTGTATGMSMDNCEDVFETR